MMQTRKTAANTQQITDMASEQKASHATLKKSVDIVTSVEHKMIDLPEKIEHSTAYLHKTICAGTAQIC
jgi:type VI protein secretion system component Hcp